MPTLQPKAIINTMQRKSSELVGGQSQHNKGSVGKETSQNEQKQKEQSNLRPS